MAATDSEGHSSFLLWPHPRYAAACANLERAGSAPASIDVRELVEGWLPAMASDRALLAVFPTPALRVIDVLQTTVAARLLQRRSARSQGAAVAEGRPSSPAITVASEQRSLTLASTTR